MDRPLAIQGDGYELGITGFDEQRQVLRVSKRKLLAGVHVLAGTIGHVLVSGAVQPVSEAQVP